MKNEEYILQGESRRTTEKREIFLAFQRNILPLHAQISRALLKSRAK
jgi:hypothetical protein